MTALLGPDGQPLAPETPVTPPPAAPGEKAAVVILDQRVVGLKDGPLKLTAKIEFEGVSIGGPEADKFVTAIDAVLTRVNSVGVRLIELMLVGAQKGKHVAPFVVGAMEDMKIIRAGLEGLLSRVSQGLDPMPRVQVAHDVPAAPKGS